MRELLLQAEKNNAAVGAFSVGNMEMVMGAIRAAEEMNAPIILQIAEVRLKHSPLHLMAPMMLAAAKEAKVDVAVHLDHGTTMETIQRALELGFTSVMYDGSAGDLKENIRNTQSVAALARKYGAAVEAELGVIGKSEDGTVVANAAFTDPDIAADFAEKTGITALAVAIGNAHGHYDGIPTLRLDILEQIHQNVKIPLVLHGGSGITPEEFRKCIDLGDRKINIATANCDALTEGVRTELATNEKANYFSLNEAAVAGVYENIKTHIRIFNNKEELV